MLEQFDISTNETYRYDVLKVIIKSALRKEQRPIPFVEHIFHRLLSAESEQK